jgi:hypothetical protein
MLTEKPEHMTDEEWSAFNDDEMGEAPKAKYEDAEVKLDDDVEALLSTEQSKSDDALGLCSGSISEVLGRLRQH